MNKSSISASKMNNATIELRWLLRQFVSTRPVLWRLVCKLRSATSNMMDEDTVLACEGYPRSANSFAEAALLLTQGNIRIAHHRHVPAQLMIACELNKPALLLIRNPPDAIASMILRESEGASIRREIKAWMMFHEAVLPLKDQLVISDFPTTINHFDEVLLELSKRFPNQIKPARTDNSCISKEAFGKIEEIAQSRNAGSKLNYGQSVTDQDRQLRKKRLAEIREIIFSEYPSEIEAAMKLYMDMRKYSVFSHPEE